MPPSSTLPLPPTTRTHPRLPTLGQALFAHLLPTLCAVKQGTVKKPLHDAGLVATQRTLLCW
eukprot:m.447158 g.447158  ORF g.447158 m.447158 type:complete len:62 (+) comp20314_c1_seq7:130-315(+)